MGVGGCRLTLGFHGYEPAVDKVPHGAFAVRLNADQQTGGIGGRLVVGEGLCLEKPGHPLPALGRIH